MSFRELWNRWVEPGSGTGEVLAIFSSLTVIILIAFICVVLFRTRRKRRHLYRHHHAPSQADPSAAHSSEPDKSRSVRRFRRRRHRRQHRTERPLNPTLSQVGGLPPMRPEDEPPKV